SGTSGRQTIERLDGLGTLAFAVRGRLLFLGNDLRLLTAVLEQAGTSPANAALTYAAGFRHSREQENYQRVMAALDFPASAASGDGAPAFFSGNIGSLSRVLSTVAEVRVTEEQKGMVCPTLDPTARNHRRSGSGTRASRADHGVRPTSHSHAASCSTGNRTLRARQHTACARS